MAGGRAADLAGARAASGAVVDLDRDPVADRPRLLQRVLDQPQDETSTARDEDRPLGLLLYRVMGDRRAAHESSKPRPRLFSATLQIRARSRLEAIDRCEPERK